MSHFPKEQAPLTDKTFMRMMMTSIIGVVLCMAALVSMTWAYFSDAVASAGNKLTAGNFSVRITVDSDSVTSYLVSTQKTVTDKTYPAVSVPYTDAQVLRADVESDFLQMENGVCIYTAPTVEGSQESETTVIFRLVADMTVEHGYCLIYVNDKVEHTSTFYNTGDEDTFTVVLTAGQTVKFAAHWGTPPTPPETVSTFAVNQNASYYITPEAQAAQANMQAAQNKAIEAKQAAEAQLKQAVELYKQQAAETNAAGKTPQETNAAGKTPQETNAAGKTPQETNAAGKTP